MWVVYLPTTNQPIINLNFTIMRTTTYYYNADGKRIKTHSGEPRNASVFERNSDDAVRIFIGSKVFKKVKTKHFPKSYRHIGVCRKVKINLQGKGNGIQPVKQYR